MVRLKARRTHKKKPMAARPGERSAGGRRYIPLMAAVLGATALTWGAWQAEQSAIASPQFRVAALEVRGLRLLTGQEVLRSSGVQVGDGQFDVDLDAVARRLDSLVWVRTARVERKPPSWMVGSCPARIIR